MTSKLDVAAAPTLLRRGVICPVMAAPRLFAQQRGFGDELCGLQHVELFGRTRWKTLGDIRQTLEGGAQAAGGACDAGIVPHDHADLVGGNLCGAAVGKWWHFPCAR